MAKLVHVTADRVRSGMRRLEAMLTDDKEWAAAIQRLDAEVDRVGEEGGIEYRQRDEMPNLGID